MKLLVLIWRKQDPGTKITGEIEDQGCSAEDHWARYLPGTAPGPEPATHSQRSWNWWDSQPSGRAGDASRAGFHSIRKINPKHQPSGKNEGGFWAFNPFLYSINIIEHLACNRCGARPLPIEKRGRHGHCPAAARSPAGKTRTSLCRQWGRCADGAGQV